MTLRDRLDLAVAEVAIRYRPIRRAFAFYGLTVHRHYSPRRAWRVTRSMR